MYSAKVLNPLLRNGSIHIFWTHAKMTYRNYQELKTLQRHAVLRSLYTEVDWLKHYEY